MTETRTYTVKSDGREITFELHHDPAYVPDRMAETFYETQWEPELVHLMFRAIRPGTRVIDGGANIGIFSLIMSRLVGPTGMVYAYEPHPDTSKRLTANLELNRSTNVLESETALWDCRRDLTLYTHAEDPGRNSLKREDDYTGSRTVRSDRLDQQFPKAPDFIKLDLEGAEERALRGADKWLAQNPLVACEFSNHHLELFGTSRKNLADYMRGFGYTLWLLCRDGNAPQPVSATEEIRGGDNNMVVLFATRQQVANLWPT